MYDLVPAPAGPLARAAGAPALDLAIAAWLDAKSNRSGSEKTRRAYCDTMTTFRGALAQLGLDLDGDSQAVALAAQGWCGAGEVAPATFNQRLAILSSFYTYAQRQGMLTSNPIARVERRVVQAYAGAHALDPAQLRGQLAAIDRSNLAGQRDYALLAIYLQTGRRLSEVAALVWADLEIAGTQIVVHFRRCKGGKQMSDQLPVAVSRTILEWLSAFYGPLGQLAGGTPLWVNLSPNGRGRRLSVDGIADICQTRLGISKVHALRHTFAKAMEDSGAKVSDIQARLGHSSLATTGRYLAALKRAENDQADDLARLFGLA